MISSFFLSSKLLSYLRIQIYSRTLRRSNANFHHYKSHMDCSCTVKLTVLNSFLSVSHFPGFLQGGQGGNHRRQCKASLLQRPCDLLGENRNAHLVRFCTQIPWCSLHNKSRLLIPPMLTSFECRYCCISVLQWAACHDYLKFTPV